jgi:Protein of unknown function (DUF1460)
MAIWLSHIISVCLVFCFSVDPAENTSTTQIGDAIVHFGKQHLGKKYLANTLEEGDDYRLILRNDVFDCMTFVEYSLACAFADQGKFDIEHYVCHLRYRDGKMNGYGSRLHYFTEWLIQAKQHGWLQDITSSFGDQKLLPTVNFMSQNRSKYKSITTDAIMNDIVNAEATINNQKLTFIPKDLVKNKLPLLQNGDIIGITTQTKGLDVSHIGIITILNGQPHLLHASTTEKKVVITKEPLYKYLLSNATQTGIIVVRPQYG